MEWKDRFITTTNKKDFNKLIECIKVYGEERFNKYRNYDPLTITLKRKLVCPKKYGDKPETFRKGTQFIYIAGEISLHQDIDIFIKSFNGMDMREIAVTDPINGCVYCCDEIVEEMYDKDLALDESIINGLAKAEQFSFK